jgi:type VI secretion system protein ImpK
VAAFSENRAAILLVTIMPDVIPATAEGGREAVGQPPVRGEKLALLYQGILTATVRIQSGKPPAAYDLFRKQMEKLLDEIEREAIKVGYRNADIQDAHYAVIAFLNESIQRSDDPGRSQFIPLMAKSFQQAVAGVQVFERLKEVRARRDSVELADLLEVYYLCCLLGFEGRYAIAGRGELDGLMEALREQIDRIRGPLGSLSPEGALPVRPPAVAPQPNRLWKTVALSCAGFAFASWVVLRLFLSWYAQGVIRDITP